MAHTYTTNLIHCVFSTKDRAKIISDRQREQLWAYLFGIARNLGVNVLAVGGTADHVHLLIAMHPNQRLAEVVRDLKANSSRWMNESGDGFSWQEGYGAFSVSPSQTPVVKQYIRNQAAHHQRRDFQEDFLSLLRKSGIEYDLKHVFG
jgi:REP element-mobilizing transposase RayT